MKKRRLLLLIIMIVTMCTGCTVEYNIDITKTNIEEIIKVNDYATSSRSEVDILQNYNMWYPTYVNFITDGETIEIEDYSEKTEGIEYHQKNIKKITNGYHYTYNYIYPINNYYDAYSIANTFIETTVHKTSDTLVLKTSKENLLCNYNYFDSLKVNISIDPEVYKLKYTNTSNIKNNTYTWNLDRSNCDNSQIILTLDIINNNQDITKKPPQDNNGLSDYTIYIFFGILIILILIGYYIFKKIKEKNENFDIDD